MQQTNMSDEKRAELIQRVLASTSTLFRGLHTGQDRAWLSVDLTMPQLKALVCIVQQDDATNSQVARSLGVGLSTMTGIIDRLAEQGMVTRREDAVDRRITRVLPTPRAQQLVDALLRYRNEHITAVLTHLTNEQLSMVEQAFQYLMTAADEVADKAQVVA